MPSPTWPLGWTKRRSKSNRKCGLGSCAATTSPWARFWPHRGGAFLQNVFYCRRECLETALLAQLARLFALPPSTPPGHRIPLGLLMVARGWLTYEQVAVALEAQQRAHTGQIGDWFEKLGFATAQQVTSALGLQWGCPVTFALEAAPPLPLSPIPLAILEALQMLPLQFVPATNTLYLAFGQRVDHAALYAVENLLECRTQPCVAGRQTVADELLRMRQRPRPRELDFGSTRDFAEIGRVSLSYMLKLGADEARLGRVADFIWLRLRVRKSFTDLLFRTEHKLTAPASRVSTEFSTHLSSADVPPAVVGASRPHPLQAKESRDPRPQRSLSEFEDY